MFVQNNHVVRALTIAGSDCSGGAGIQADLKTFARFEVYGASVITALTAQNTQGVTTIADQCPDFVDAQLTAVLCDLGADAIKVGMLSHKAMIETVAFRLQQYKPRALVVDPVMIAKGGAKLLQPQALPTFIHTLLPLTDIVTPNIEEAELLCGFRIASQEDMRKAARKIATLGPSIVVIKGGHAFSFHPDEAIDFLYQKDKMAYWLHTPRINTANTHGTGCTFSAAITAMVARGASPLTAITTAKAFITDAIDQATMWDIGAGHGPVDHSVPFFENVTIPNDHAHLYYDQHQWSATK